MTDWSTIDSGFGRDTQPDEESDQVVVAPDGGAGGWEAFDDPDAPEPRSATTPDRPEPHTVTPAPDGGAGGWEAFDDPNAISRDRPAGSWAAPEVASRDRVAIDADSSGDAAVTLPADRQSPAAILQPGGELIGTPGASTGIRELPGHRREAEELYERLSTGGREAAPPGYSGRAVELPDGGFVGLRLESKSGGPAIDVNIPGIEITRIHFR